MAASTVACVASRRILAALVYPSQCGWKDLRRQARSLEHRRDRPRLGQHRRYLARDQMFKL
jgi:hypothetical protein